MHCAAQHSTSQHSTARYCTQAVHTVSLTESEDEDEITAGRGCELEDIGWTESLSKFTGIDKDAFAELAPNIVIGFHEKLNDSVAKAMDRMYVRRRGSKCPTHAEACARINQMVTQRMNLYRRRSEWKERTEAESITIEGFMKEHRHAFEQSYVQRQFREIDVQLGCKPDQAPHKVYHIVQVFGTSIRRNIDIRVHTGSDKTRLAKARQHTRFTSMLQEYYGGRKAYRTFLDTGLYVDIRLPPVRRLPGSAPTDAAATTSAEWRGERSEVF